MKAGKMVKMKMIPSNFLILEIFPFFPVLYFTMKGGKVINFLCFCFFSLRKLQWANQKPECFKDTPFISFS